MGCNGGEVWGAYQYWMDQENYLIKEIDYRFQNSDSMCDYDSRGKTDFQVQQYYTVPPNNTE